MISHSAITVVWMLLAWLIAWLAGDWFTVPIAFAAFISGVWWEREQYVAELDQRKAGNHGWQHVPATMISMFPPTQKNLDFLVPVPVAWIGAALLIMLGG